MRINTPDKPGYEVSAPWKFAKGVATTFMRIFGRYEWRNVDKLPTHGPFILVANHVSHADVIVMGWLLVRAGRAPRFLAKSSLFTVPGLGWVLRRMGQIPVERKRGAGGPSLQRAAELIQKGLAVIIYPEGTLTRDPDRWPMRGRVGAARLALQYGIPVIPAAHWGVQEMLPPYAKFFTFRIPRTKVVSTVGDPVDLTRWYTEGADPSPESLTEATEAIMTSISALVGELRGETPPAKRWDPKEHGQSETGRFEPPAKKD